MVFQVDLTPFVISRSIFFPREEEDDPNPPGIVSSHPIKDVAAVMSLDNWHSANEVANFNGS